MVASLVFAGMLLVASAGVFGGYALGFKDGVKDSDTRRLLEAYRNEATAWHELHKEPGSRRGPHAAVPMADKLV
jgi:hypothetical protein